MSHAATARPSKKSSDPREFPNYRLPEAAHYLRVPESTLRTWIFGLAYRTTSGMKTSRPLIRIPDGSPLRLSFLNMVEAHVLERSWHVITTDVERAEVGRLAADFLERVAPDGRR